MSNNTSVSGRWSSNFAYILAATGAAVGLGNIWRFPYIMGEHGGGAFVLVYLICIALIGVPVMMAEVYIGKQGRSTPANAMAKVAEAHGRSRHWGMIGGMGVLAGFLILSFYVVIAGWAVAYVGKSVTGEIAAAAGDADAVGALFGALLADPWQLILWSSIVTFGTAGILAKGVNKGLEKSISMLMPALFILLAIVMVYAAATGAFGEAARFMFYPDFSKLTVQGVLIALGHAFFTLSLSSGIMIMYGAYLPEGTSITKTSFAIAAMDTLVALMAGLAIYPIVFANGIEPGAGPGLLFVSLPIAFGTMPLGSLVSTLFFAMIVVAAFTSAMALMESAAAYLVERRGFERAKASWTAGTVIWVMSLLTVASFTEQEWVSITLMGWETNFFGVIDKLTEAVMLPLGGLLVAVFVGWVMCEDLLEKSMAMSKNNWNYFFGCLKYVAPVAISVVFFNAFR
ncbi:sodium-dependent transporter [Aliagarivorans marinus]|uniref:sodium-dependent transporter n=1 Tax=Aliagarivorans marinus TaxID=561965 RepID=UPI000406264D|nr:sodium-dependent transporter [Aliagarivorans marinus]